jgi:hypothetical protein
MLAQETVEAVIERIVNRVKVPMGASTNNTGRRSQSVVAPAAASA